MEIQDIDPSKNYRTRDGKVHTGKEIKSLARVSIKSKDGLVKLGLIMVMDGIVETDMPANSQSSAWEDQAGPARKLWNKISRRNK